MNINQPQLTVWIIRQCAKSGIQLITRTSNAKQTTSFNDSSDRLHCAMQSSSCVANWSNISYRRKYVYKITVDKHILEANTWKWKVYSEGKQENTFQIVYTSWPSFATLCRIPARLLLTHLSSFCGHTTEFRALSVWTALNFSFRTGSSAGFFVNITCLKLSLNTQHSHKSLNQ